MHGAEQLNFRADVDVEGPLGRGRLIIFKRVHVDQVVTVELVFAKAPRVLHELILTVTEDRTANFIAEETIPQSFLQLLLLLLLLLACPGRHLVIELHVEGFDGAHVCFRRRWRLLALVQLNVGSQVVQDKSASSVFASFLRDPLLSQWLLDSDLTVA